jgi:hypothetical protein
MLVFWVGLKRSVLIPKCRRISRCGGGPLSSYNSPTRRRVSCMAFYVFTNLTFVRIQGMQNLEGSNSLSDSKASSFCSRTPRLLKPSTHTGGAARLHFRLVPLKRKFLKKSPIALKPLESNCRCTIQREHQVSTR